ncbi:MAG TPA: 3'(2'),5'-bisphosphate nucleotidase CysQ [Candidatus Saccharimonadales bacterium]|nr:3'(2'),5'-bisphosphate nucleotidase CysQ [Candidatus Saccharimonadales bacterium]
MGGEELVVTSDHELARFGALEAGRALLTLRAELGFEDSKRLRDEGDRVAHELLMKLLAEQRPDDAVLSEEGADDQDRLTARRVWIVDPLDGTREFGETGRTDWAVHVALIADGTPIAAAVSLPARDLVMSTLPAPRRPLRAPGRMRLVVSRSHTPPEAHAVAEALDAELVFMGSAGAKTMAVVLGDADAYLHLGGQYEWDSAAPVGVALAAGLCATRADGSPLRYNCQNPWLPDQVVCRADLHDAVVSAVGAALAATPR